MQQNEIASYFHPFLGEVLSELPVCIHDDTNMHTTILCAQVRTWRHNARLLGACAATDRSHDAVPVPSNAAPSYDVTVFASGAVRLWLLFCLHQLSAPLSSHHCETDKKRKYHVWLHSAIQADTVFSWSYYTIRKGRQIMQECNLKTEEGNCLRNSRRLETPQNRTLGKLNSCWRRYTVRSAH